MFVACSMADYDTMCGSEAGSLVEICLVRRTRIWLFPCLSMHAVYVAHGSQCERQCVGLRIYIQPARLGNPDTRLYDTFLAAGTVGIR